MDVSSFFSVVGGIFGLLGLVGGAVAYLVAGRQKATIEVLSKNNEALVERVAIVERSEAECKVRLAVAEASVKTLTEVVTNAQAVAEMLARVDLHHADLLALDRKLESHFTEVKELLSAGAP